MTHVDPDMAVSEMTKLWRSFGQETSDALLSTWRRMCLAFSDAGHSSVGWTALAMPTGIGKTQFAALYCALLPNPSLSLHNLRSVELHPGVIFVTRLIAEAIAFAEAVNTLAGRNIAAAYYSGSPTKLEDTKNFPVLVITHRGFDLHQSEETIAAGGNVWEQLLTWHQGHRSKIIIDEMPTFITSSVRIDTKDLAQTLCALAWLRDAKTAMYTSMKRLLSLSTNPTLGNRRRRLNVAELECLHSIDTELILTHLKSVDDSAITVEHGKEQTSLRKTCTNTVNAIRQLQANGWGWISFHGLTAQLHSAVLHPALQHGSGVILDATADLCPGYDLLSPRANIVKAENNTRCYGNVTLYLAWVNVAGKESLVANADRLWPEYRSGILSLLSEDERVLICCHDGFEQKVRDDPNNPSRMTFEHYGNLDGRNDWRDYEAVALIGLYHLPSSVHVNAVQALIGPQTDQWLQSATARAIRPDDDILTKMPRGQLATNAIQAIGRVRLRKMIDAMGQCLPTKVFLPLPADADGRAVHDAILDHFPGLQIKPWPLDVAKRKVRADSGIVKLLNFFRSVPQNPYTKAEVRGRAPISGASLDRVIQRINEPSSKERVQLAELGVTYHARSGRGAQSFFVKA